MEESASTEIVGHVALGRFGGFEHDRELLGLFLELDRVDVRVTVTDPKAYTHPFTVTLNEYLERAGELMDFVCLENDSSGPQFLGK